LQGLGGDGADAAGAKELRKSDQQVDGKDDDFSHRANRTPAAGARKAARRVRVAFHWEFATHTYSEYAIVRSWSGKSGFSVGGWKPRYSRFRPGSLRDS
jgi:hypothetical protein